MPMLAFMPWCRIDRAYDIGEVKILPFKRQTPIDGLDDAMRNRVNTILASYKNIVGRPVDHAAILRYDGKSVTDDLNEDEQDTIHELVSLACFCGLAGREYFNELGRYCNSDCFLLYFQKFDKADYTAITSRRREGQTLMGGLRTDEIAISIPFHCHAVREVNLDEALLRGLTSHRNNSCDGDWARWQNALMCFNWANTDSENIRHQVEWVLLCSAFEHILGAKSEAKDVATKFSAVMVPSDPLLANDATRRSDRWKDNGRPLRYEWMYEFYRIRGDLAHGKLNTQQPTTWSLLEHLVLATIAFPLVVRCLLEKNGCYELTDDDRAQIEAFEGFADTPNFLRPPRDQRHSLDSCWSRHLSKARSSLRVQKITERLQRIVEENYEAKELLPHNRQENLNDS